ncbi:Structure-specific endonuclease subunit SLX4 [Papilio machaon]|uniref:Structure-specific endonuclease subunit SLX4 n=1 Tax=Papilio machaon TaxID=76193 RepID=A0A0N1INR6_PAPMA|nr:Structure-specific endonuclease subunit SLX4 [Papilio machaon]
MDESLTDFQERKKICTGPKTNKPRVKKLISKKRLKGQKDIRTLVRPKKNELLTFTKDFNNVCAQGGIDVDSQQLQLAIALSKSLQQSDQTETEDFPTNNLTSQERTNRIRRTLQEYGFRIPQAKIKLEACKRIKKYRKPYKLLQITEEERLQKICNRYSQVLFDNPDKSFEKDTNDCNIDSKLYHLASNTSYDFIRTNKIYITEILHEISVSKGNLLRDWSDIPGRPESPKLVEDYVISMQDIECSQNELDIILSGPLYAAKDILKSKLNNSYLNTINQISNIPEINITSENTESKNNEGLNELQSSQDNLLTMQHKQNRSNSPDIFDDDTSIIDHSISDNQNVEKESTKIRDSNVSILNLTSTEVTNKVDACSQSSDNITKRKSNDFMDLTECVPVKSHCKIKLLETTNKVDLAHNSMEFTKCVNPISQDSNNSKEQTKNSLSTEECVSLEEEDKTRDGIPAVVSELEKELDYSSDNTIILKDDYIDLTQNCGPKVLVEDSLRDDNMETMDLTQSSNSNDDLPVVNIPGTQRLSPDDTIIVQYDGCDDIPQTNIVAPSNSIKLNNDVIEVNEDFLDISNILTVRSPSRTENRSTIIHNSKYRTEDLAESQSFSSEIVTSSNKENGVNIDLTQSSDSTVDGYHESSTGNVSENLQINDCDSLGKKGDVSIDYDELDHVVENVSPIDEERKHIQSRATNFSQSPNNSSISDNFELCDRELNYSLYKSRVDIDYEGISIVDTNNEVNYINKSKSTTCYNNYTINRSLSESDLPISDRTNCKDKQYNITLNKSACSTPIKATVTNDRVSIKTPTNSEYVVKLGEVTPMLDYEAMSSPEMNKELEKYGLKPFKRKRAIQLLTHLYNQTHPIIEQCSEDPVPFKKFKPNSPEINSSEKNNIILDKENIYSETKTNPDIRNIECCSDDWVFQKRGKAKVYSCPVPLHIAFHNYVSCRRHLREAILRYEPINIDVIHKDLVSYGYKYNPKDLLKFLDRKCITVKTADNTRNNKFT